MLGVQPINLSADGGGCERKQKIKDNSYDSVLNSEVMSVPLLGWKDAGGLETWCRLAIVTPHPYCEGRPWSSAKILQSQAPVLQPTRST